MNVKSISIVAALVASFGSSAALAADLYEQNQNLPAAVSTRATASAAGARAQVAAVDEYQQNLNTAVVAKSSLPRAQVVAEAIEARKLGLLVGGEIGNLAPTAAQAAQIRLAGQHAVGVQYAGK